GFPDLDKLLAETVGATTVVEAETGVLAAAVRRAAALAARTSPIRLTKADGGLAVSTTGDGEDGRARDTVPATCTGEVDEVDLQFNPGFLADALGALAGDRVRITTAGQRRPALFTPLAETG